MKLIEINFTSDYKPTQEEIVLLKAAQVYGPPITYEEGGSFHYWTDYLMDADKMPYVPHTLKRVVFNSDTVIGLDTNTVARHPVVNQKVNVVVPGLGLLMLSEVRVATDYCTEDLNIDLRQGWRIVAVCMQPDQRRPDYILGRVREE